MTGTVLVDRYVLGNVVGKGGMGLVHEAVDLKLQRAVAVKLLATAVTTADSLRRFSREALAAGSLQHPNVVGVFDTGEQHGRPFLVTELLRGETLRQRLARGPIHFEQARSWALQLAAGLSAAHEKGLIHRDLKPSNIFITADGWVKILDFGLVQIAQSLPDSAAHPSGTIGYMAPEQVRGQPLDARADLFNFGLVLYEMLSGERAFSEISATETSYSIVLREPKPLPGSVPPELRKLVSRCLSKDRESRPASAGEALRLLRAQPLRSRLRWLPAAVLLLPLLALAALAWKRAHGPIPEGTVAIFPFDSPGLPARTATADGLSDLLLRDLEGTALHGLEHDTIRWAAREAAAASATDQARTASLELGARYFVDGHVDERDGGLSIEASLRDTQSGRTLSSAAARGKPDELLRLVRQISDQLQKKPLQPAQFQARLRGLERQTTASAEALRAWLEAGYYIHQDDHVDQMIAHLQRAVSLDPEFAQAYSHLARFAGTWQPAVSAEALRHALSLQDRLPLAERINLRFQDLKERGEWAEVEQFLSTARNEHLDDAQIRRLLPVYLFHRVPLLGRSPQETASLFQQQIELDPLDLESLGRLAELAELRGERAVVAQLTDRLIAHYSNDQSLYHLKMRAWARRNSAEHDRAMALLRKPGMSHSFLLNALMQSAMQMDGTDLHEMAALLPVGEGHQSFQPRAFANLITGHIGAARRDVEDALAAGAGNDTAYYLPWIDTLDLVAPSPAQLDKARAAAARLDVLKDPTRAAAKLYLLGMLALRARDSKAAEAQVAALQALPEIAQSTIVADHVLALRARILAAQGDPAGALALYDQQKIRIPEKYTYFYRRPRDHFFRASLLVALGRPREALPLYEALAGHNLIDPVFYPAGQLHQAHIYDSLGEKQNAVDRYERFVAMWRDCDPEERPELERAQARLAQLRAVQ